MAEAVALGSASNGASAAATAAPTPVASTAAASAAAADTKTDSKADAPPNQTIYVHNLNEKIKKDELKKSLYHVFSQFGNILEVVAQKTYKMRGQAWIIFEDLSGSTKAFKEMTNFNFYGKPMKVTFAKAKSDVVSKADGTFVPRPKRKVDGKDGKKKRGAGSGGDKQGPSKKIKTESSADDKKSKNGDSSSATAAASGGGGAGGSVPASHAVAHALLQSMEATPPNRILFVENLPSEANQMMLAMLFQQYTGYTEVRLVPGKPGIAFVEFQDAYQAGAAMTALQNFKITPTNLMKISYARQ